MVRGLDPDSQVTEAHGRGSQVSAGVTWPRSVSELELAPAYCAGTACVGSSLSLTGKGLLIQKLMLVVDFPFKL